MSEKGCLKNKKIEVIALVILAGILQLHFGFLIYRYNKNKDFIYEKHLQENVITINSENITLKDFSYYVYVVEKKINEMALQYNPDDANEFWNTHFKNSLDSVFTRDYAKQLAIDLCEYDYIMEYESTVYNLYLTDSDKQSCKSNAHDTYEDMSEKAHNNTKLTEDDIYNILCRKKLVEKYVTRAAQKVQEEGFEGDSSLFNYDGDFYKEKIKIKYDVTENHKLLDKITMGRVTVNQNGTLQRTRRKTMTKDMTKGSPLRLILGFAFPMLLGMLFQQFYNLVDTMIVGKTLGVSALAGVGATSLYQFYDYWFCMGICSGFAIPVAQQFGAGKYSELRKYVFMGMYAVQYLLLL